MAVDESPLIEAVTSNPDRYQATELGFTRLRTTPVSLEDGTTVLLIRDPVPVGVRRELAARCFEHPPLWVVRLEGPFRWALGIRDAAEAEELEEALNERSLDTLACLSVAIRNRRVRPHSFPTGEGE